MWGKQKDDENVEEPEPVAEPVQQEWLTPDTVDPMIAVRERHAAAEAGEDVAA
jgi:hypothetical protein